MDAYFKLQQAIRGFGDIPDELIQQLYGICKEKVIRLIILDKHYIHFEEEMMQKKFGAAYLDYKKRVRKWI